MTRFRNQIAVWSSLHEQVLIYGSSHISVFESPMHQVHNEPEVGSPISWFGSHERVRNTATRNHTHMNARTYTYIHNY